MGPAVIDAFFRVREEIRRLCSQDATPCASEARRCTNLTNRCAQFNHAPRAEAVPEQR